jgi:outer membrane protein assembly factor BamB
MRGSRRLATTVSSGAAILAVVVAMFAASYPTLAPGPKQPRARAVAALPATAGSASWTTYHYDNTRAGYDPNEPSFSTFSTAWTQTGITGDIYAEPLVYGSTVYVVTEDNYLYALDAGTGGLLWTTGQLSVPENAGNLPCGNITPHVGITGTPVIDTALNRIFMVGMVSTHRYVLWGVDLTTHALVVNSVVDLSPTLDPYVEGQRGALALSQGVVYIPYGGRYGDCGSYHGAVVGAHDTDGAVLYSFVVPGSASGIWAAGGESVDAAGNVYVATGNGSSAGSESVYKLNPNLTVAARWVPADQSSLDAGDTDVGSISPGLVGGGDLIQGGKSGDVYLLDSTMGQRQKTSLCGGEELGATAYFSPYIYIPCSGGLFAIQQSGNTFTSVWSTSFSSGPPILAGGAVIVIDPYGDTMYALNPATGAQITSINVGAVGHFVTPATGDGMVFVGGTSQVLAFKLGGCTSAAMSASPSSPQAPGTSVTFTATSTTCPTPEYRFFVQPPAGSWTAQTAYGGPSWTWNTTGLPAGVYGVGVWVRQAGSSAAYEAYWLGTYTLSVLTCNAASLSTAAASPSAPGAMVTFSATAARCPAAQFRFWMLPPGGSWTMQRDYGSSSWTWNTSGLSPGTYELGVWARQAGSTNSYDAYGFTTFVLGAGNCTSAGLAPNVAPPQPPTTTVTFSATSNSCASPQYQFWLLPPGGAWTVEQPFSASTTWSWNTSAFAPGTYQVGVWARQSGSTARYDAYFIGTFQLDVGTCTAAGISASPVSPQAPGTSITFSATSTGCSSPRYEFWMLPPPGTNWSVVQPYAATTSFVWNSTGQASGPYRFGVWARQNGSANSYDSYAIVTFWLGG